MQQSKVLETWVGLFVALGMVALFFLAMKVSNLSELQVSDNSYRLIARFQNAGSLRERAPVSMSGVRIGRVSSIRFDKETYEAVVEMRIDPEYDTIPEDTTANILTAGLLGEQYIGLTAGGSPDFLKDGDTIELSQSAMVLEEVISRFLFNKAESGAENKSQPSAKSPEAEGRAEPASAAEAPAKREESQVPIKPKQERVGEEAESAGKQKANHGKPPAAASARPKPKAGQEKGAEPVEAVHRAQQPAR